MGKPVDRPSRSEKQEIRSRLTLMGIPAADARELAAEDDAAVTGREISERIIAWCRTLKKGK